MKDKKGMKKKSEESEDEQRKQEEKIRKKELEKLTKKYDEAVRVSRTVEEHHDSKALYSAAGIFD